MKQLILFIICAITGITTFAQEADTVRISTTQTTHIRFTTDLKYVDLGSKAIVGKIVDSSKDIVALKAREPFDYCTSISCLETSGRIHSFIVAYEENPEHLIVDMTATPANHPAVVSEITVAKDSILTYEKICKMPKEIYHIGAKDNKISVECDNIFVHDDILYIAISVYNNSSVSYTLSTPRFVIESKRKTKRGIQYEKAVYPKEVYGLGTTLPGKTSMIVLTFDKISLIRGQVFRIYLYEQDGLRNFTLTIDNEI